MNMQIAEKEFAEQMLKENNALVFMREKEDWDKEDKYYLHILIPVTERFKQDLNATYKLLTSTGEELARVYGFTTDYDKLKTL